ncbi:MAG: hypothetical protein JNM31_02030 [Flavobacteriales bacterium]|nr:hypothetical protein [Flavobacteriales bacterium]
MKLLRSLCSIPAALLAGGTFAQSQTPDWLQETLFHSGKINTVVAVVALVLVGLAIWMAAFDRRLTKLEKRNGQQTTDQ